MGTPVRSALPETMAVYRGSKWVLRFNFDWDVSANTYVLKLAPTLNSATGLLTATADLTHLSDASPYATFTLSSTTTAAISTATTSFEWDLDVTNLTETHSCGTVPVRGQVGT